MDEFTRDVLIRDYQDTARSEAAAIRFARGIDKRNSLRCRLGVALIGLGERLSGVRVEPVRLEVVAVNRESHPSGC